jgi:hypothetical protein
MILISHRGNVQGPSADRENTIPYIQKALDLGFEVEIDLRVSNDILYLGHDAPQHQLNIEWLKKNQDRLWIHCKEIKAIEKILDFSNSGISLNYFWHESDTLTITSKGYIWAYPGKQPISASIAVMPEIYGDKLDSCIGICSDYIEKYK